MWGKGSFCVVAVFCFSSFSAQHAWKRLAALSVVFGAQGELERYHDYDVSGSLHVWGFYSFGCSF